MGPNREKISTIFDLVVQIFSPNTPKQRLLAGFSFKKNDNQIVKYEAHPTIH